MYSSDMTWQQWTAAVQQSADSLINNIVQAKMLADKWNAMVYGLTSAQIQALTQFTGTAGATATAITAITYCMGVFTNLWNFLFNYSAFTAPTANQEGYLDPFV
jgi:hypothetical protein